MQTYILGGYTKRFNKGISEIQFNPADQSLSQTQLIANLNSSTFVALNSTKDLLFALNKKDDQGGLVVFEKQNGSWRKVSEAYASGATGCHITFRQASQTIYVSNYHEASIDIYQLDSNKQVRLAQRIQHHGSSVHPNQNQSHIHFTGFNQNEDLLYVCDLGSDKVYVYQVKTDGSLSVQSELITPAGMGPRHIAFHPDLNRAYIIGELNNHTLEVRIDSVGNLEIEADYPNFNEKVDRADGAAIRISSDGRFLYTSTRFHNILSVFAVDDQGHLNLVQTIDSHGQIPRDFIIDESEAYLLVGHQDSDNLVLFSRDTQSGRLNLISENTNAPECVCIAHA